WPAATLSEVFEHWSSAMRKPCGEAAIPRRVPPPLPACTAEDSSETPRIASPLLGVTYTLRSSHRDGVIALDAGAAADVQNFFWFDGGALIGKSAVGIGALAWRPAEEGNHLIRVIDDHGRASERDA